MLIIGCDYHPAFQQIAFVDTETGECGERQLQHREEAEKSTAISRPREYGCAWGSKPVGTRAGLHDCSPSYRLSCGPADIVREAIFRQLT